MGATAAGVATPRHYRRAHRTVRGRLLRLLGKLRPSVGRGDGHYVPDSYWESRANDLISTYDSPETWQSRGWPSYEPEERHLPPLLEKFGIGSVLVVGAGSGREYALLRTSGIDLRGFDIS